jgi:hypothetical protein
MNMQDKIDSMPYKGNTSNEFRVDKKSPPPAISVPPEICCQMPSAKLQRHKEIFFPAIYTFEITTILGIVVSWDEMQ